MTPEIAELAGAIIGDGHIHFSNRAGKTDYVISVAFNCTEDREYVSQLSHLFQASFGLTPAIKLMSHCNELILRSKFVTQFFSSAGIPQGRKAAVVVIPDAFLTDENLKRACIRGVFDTDFSVAFKKKHRTRHTYPVISLSTVSKPLRDQLHSILAGGGFRNVYSIDRIQVTQKGTPVKIHELYISGSKELERWMELIGSSNPRHKTKYLIWKRFGFCPPATTLAERQSILSGRISPDSFYGKAFP
ncbi:LAGLIDADG-like domain protein [uncultured archaeon]|nr:LAGLIDADG-like domain protein [uncultured archaeon]